MDKDYLFFLTLIALIVIVFSCQSESGSSDEHNTPENVLKLYQRHFDKNEFEHAKKLSTEAGKRWIEDIAPMIVNEFSDSTILTTVFNSLDCTIEKDTALCFCELEDDNESYTAFYRLIKIQDRWLVDAPDEEVSIEYEDEEIAVDSFLMEK